MLDRNSLDSILPSLAARGLLGGINGYAYRSIGLRHFLPPKVPAPLYAAQSGLLGTRFVPPNRPTASLYIADGPEVAHREGNQIYYQTSRIPGLDPGEISPPDEVVIVGVRVRLSRLLDVRSGAVMGQLETTRDELLAPWKTVPDAPTQRLGASVYASGLFEGIAYGSAQHPPGSCLVIFPRRLRPGSFVEFESRTLGVPDARLAGPRA